MGEAARNPVVIAAHSRPKCQTCPHYVPQDKEQGHCRFFPPTPMMIPMQVAAPAIIGKPPQMRMELQLQSSWPPTRGDRWCGQHPHFGMWLAKHGADFSSVDRLDLAKESGSA